VYCGRVAETLRDWALAYADPMISAGIERLVDSVTPGLNDRLTENVDAHDEQIAILGLAVARSESLLADAVLAARNSGRTWSQIADALGIERVTAQTRFSANSTAASTIGGSVLSRDNTASELDWPSLGDIRRVQFYSVGSTSEINLLGTYGWRVQEIDLSTSLEGGIASVELDNQQWEYQITSRKKRSPEGAGWEQIPYTGIVIGGPYYWGRPLGKTVRSGNNNPKTLLGLAN